MSLAESETEILTATASRPTATVRDVLHAQIVLLAAAGETNAEIAWLLGARVDTVRKWRNRQPQLMAAVIFGAGG